jgi:hypothetical protein
VLIRFSSEDMLKNQNLAEHEGKIPYRQVKRQQAWKAF